MMKLFVLIILSVLHNNAFGQAKQLNKLFEQYGYTWEYNKQLPVALQDSRELIVPHYIESMGELSVIKWKDITSVKIFDNRNGNIFVCLYGKVNKYRKCRPADTNPARHLDTLYCKMAKTDSVRLIFTSKIDSIKLAHSDTVRNELRKLFHQLNNSPVAENYRPKPLNKPVEYNSATKEITIYRTYDSDEKLVIAAEDLANAKKIAISYVNEKNEITRFNIFSFDLYLVKGEIALSQVLNQTGDLSDETIKLLRTAQPGTFLMFDNVRVGNIQEGFRTIPGIVISVK